MQHYYQGLDHAKDKLDDPPSDKTQSSIPTDHCYLNLGKWAMYGRTRILSGQHEREFAVPELEVEQTHLPHLGRLCKRATYHKA